MSKIINPELAQPIYISYFLNLFWRLKFEPIQNTILSFYRTDIVLVYEAEDMMERTEAVSRIEALS